MSTATEKSSGVTATERMLTCLCDRTFLKLWSYTNPFNDKGDELCDILAIFNNHVFIFFDRESSILENQKKNMSVKWKRWKKKVIDAQIKTANGAERYIKSGRKIYLDQAKKDAFPIKLDDSRTIVHKIIIAHGSENACNIFGDNISGSLGIVYSDINNENLLPFIIFLDKSNPVHIFDSYNIEIILGELDTFYDLSQYLIEKERAIKEYAGIAYCGEEDLLAHYFCNYDNKIKKHFIGSVNKKYNIVIVAEGEWKNFQSRSLYKKRKEADEQSYFWDELIQRTCNNVLHGTGIGDSPLEGRSAIHEMAKEPRFHRRYLSGLMIDAIQKFPENADPIVRHIRFIPSYYKDKGYVFLQLKVPENHKNYDEHREKRKKILEIACGVAKNKFNHLVKIIGIAIYAPKYSKGNSEDFILLDCEEWPEEIQKYYRTLNKEWNFFNDKSLNVFSITAEEFPTSSVISRLKIS